MKKLLIFIFCISSLFANEEIEVNLSTKQLLYPAYLSKVFNEQSNLDDSYLEKLFQVLKFDLNSNGFMNLSENNHQKEFKISHFDEEIAFDQKFWKSQKAAFVIKPEVNKNSLKISVYNVNNNLLKAFSDIELTGNLTKDRLKLHSLCDNISEIIFGKKGIASSKILYSIRSKNSETKWQSEIWLCDSDGYNTKKISVKNSYFVHPLFIPNSASNDYIYVSYINGQPKLYRSSINNPNQSAQLVKLRGNQLLPTLSIDGTKLAFISDAAGSPDIFLQHFDHNSLILGKPIQLFAFPRSTCASPSFSPDGTKLAFVSDKDGAPRIYVIKIPENLYSRKRPIAHLITKKNRQNVTPSWSKDGKKLAYSAKTDNVRQIWIYDFEKDEEWQLTMGPKNKENPIWSKNSIHLIYNTEDANEAELYLTNINQKKSIKITNGEGRKRFPSFEP